MKNPFDLLPLFFVFTIFSLRTWFGNDDANSEYLLLFMIGIMLIISLAYKNYTSSHHKSNLDTLKDSEVSISNALNILCTVLETRDAYTKHHSESVANHALGIAESMNLPIDSCRNIYIGALLHDIGKIYIPDNILNKADRLTDEEFKLIQEHPVKGFQIVSSLDAFKDTCIPNIVMYHHEKMDGTGYPNGLSSHEIPLEARIVALCDAYDAMTSTRSYRHAMSSSQAIELIKLGVGTQFDPIVAEHFLKYMDDGANQKGQSIIPVLK